MREESLRESEGSGEDNQQKNHAGSAWEYETWGKDELGERGEIENKPPGRLLRRAAEKRAHAVEHVLFRVTGPHRNPR